MDLGRYRHNDYHQHATRLLKRYLKYICVSHKHYINVSPSKLKNVVDVGTHVRNTTPLRTGLFTKTSLLRLTKQKLTGYLISTVESILGERLLVENRLGELGAVDPEIRQTLLRLIERGLVRSWTIDVVTQTKSYLVAVTLDINSFISTSKESLRLIGANGTGAARTVNQALKIALAECIERFAGSTYNKNKLRNSTLAELKKSNQAALTPEYFDYYSSNQLETVFSLPTPTTPLSWIASTSLVNNATVLVPAQAVFTLFSQNEPQEPFFIPANSSGVAAFSDTTTAKVRALFELLERDSILDYWLLKKTPQTIDLATVVGERSREIITHLKGQGFSLHILLLESALGIPVIVSMITGSRTRSMAFIGACCDFSLACSIEKSLTEAAQMAQFYDVTDEETMEKVSVIYPNFTNFTQRYAWWCIPKNQEYLGFLLTGDKISQNEVAASYPEIIKKTTPELTLSTLKKLAAQKNIEVYFINVTNQLATTEGLFVYRAIAPNLLPMYFKESHKPIRHPRLRDKVINPIPHPFL